MDFIHRLVSQHLKTETTGFRNVVSFYCLLCVLGLCVCVFPGLLFYVGILVLLRL
jgi:hypothetical protein